MIFENCLLYLFKKSFFFCFYGKKKRNSENELIVIGEKRIVFGFSVILESFFVILF